MQKVATALIGGNSVILKPSELTPLSTLEIGRIARGVLPDGVFNIIGGGRAVGTALVLHRGIDKVSFTGSTATGVHIAKQSADHLRPVTLELGGNDPAILLPDGPISDLVDEIIAKSLANRGQYCAAIKRVYVPTALYAELCERLVVGTAWVNHHGNFDPTIPFPLIKDSGMGTDFTDYGIKGAMRLQVVNAKKA